MNSMAVPQTGGSFQNSLVYQKPLPPSYFEENPHGSAIQDDDFCGSDAPMMFNTNCINFGNSEEVHSATSLNNNENVSRDVKLNFSPMTSFQRRLSDEPILQVLSSKNDATSQPFVKLFRALNPSELKRKLSLRLSLRGEKQHQRHVCLDCSKGDPRCIGRCSKRWRHSWSGSTGKSRKWRSSFPAISSGNESQLVCDTSSKSRDSGALGHEDGFAQPGGVQLLVKVDIHRTVTGEPVVCDCENPTFRSKEKRRVCGDDPLAIRTDIRSSLKRMIARPPATFNNNYRSRYSVHGESSQFSGSLCTYWLKVIDHMTRPCPGCSEYIGPALITMFVLIVLGCVLAVILFLTWIIGGGFGW